MAGESAVFNCSFEWKVVFGAEDVSLPASSHHREFHLEPWPGGRAVVRVLILDYLESSVHKAVVVCNVFWPDSGADLQHCINLFIKNGSDKWSNGIFRPDTEFTNDPKIEHFNVTAAKKFFEEKDQAGTAFTFLFEAVFKRPLPQRLPETEVPVTDLECRLLCLELADILDTEDSFSDVTVRCGATAFRCHKAILSARSDVFKAMFRSGLRESLEPEVDVRQVEAGVMRILLRFVYTAHLAQSDVSLELLQAAHLYAVKGLVKACALTLSKDLCVANCCAMLEMCHLYDCKDSFQTALHFLRLNKGHVTATDAWRRIAANAALMEAIAINI